MIYQTPPMTDLLGELDALDEIRRQLGREVALARPWVGNIRRTARAQSALSSIAIEGFRVTEEEALEIIDRGAPSDDPNQRALAGYAFAMEHVAALSDDPSFSWSDRLILDLHFEACASQRSVRPGRWRTGPIFVTAPHGRPGEVAYRAPDAAQLPGLVSEMLAWLTAGDLDAHVVVRAAMAHLHLVSLHPFEDGNGRLSRILQSLILAREGLLSPELGSIEPLLARDTAGYYGALMEVQGGSYRPERDATPWVAYCIRAHRILAGERVQLLSRAAERWERLEALISERGWPDRLVIALEMALHGGVERAAYANEAEISAATASADLRRLLDAGLLERQGAARNTRYRASEHLRTRIS